MRIGIDAMGGDHAPKVVIEGALAAKPMLPQDAEIILIGRKDDIEAQLAALGVSSSPPFAIVNAPEVVGMGEHPTKALTQKKESSIAIGYGMLAQKKLDVFASAGNTGAMLVGAMFAIKTIEGIIRPGIAGFIPKLRGEYGIVMDVGANAEVKPDVLAQWAEISTFYGREVLGWKNPRVGLMSLGEEEEKGTLTTQAAHQLIKVNSQVNFVGNVEGRDVFNDKCDIIICDGFVGNLILKLSESMWPILKERNFVDNFVKLFNWEEVGGSPVLGINSNVIIGHGSSSSYAIRNMIVQAQQLANSNTTERLKEYYRQKSSL